MSESTGIIIITCFNPRKHVSGGILWANLHLLFWLSLFPFTTGWVGENHVAPIPTTIYGAVRWRGVTVKASFDSQVLVMSGEPI
jgi:uncharacterized membrane protein